MRLDDSPAARLQQDCTTAVKYKTVVRWQMGLFSVWHSGRIISQILVPVDQSGALSLVGRVEIVLSLVETFIELKYFHDVATPAL